MARGNKQDLYLAINGDVSGLKAAATAGRSVINQFGSEAINVIEEVEREFRDLGKGANPTGLQEMERAYEATFRQIGARARDAMKAAPGQQVEILDANATRQAAEAATMTAASIRTAAEAANRLDLAAGGADAGIRKLTAGLTAQALVAEQEASALMEQARLLGMVEGEMEKVSTAQARSNAMTGQTRAGFQQLGYQIGDVATMYSMGASASMIFASQSGQVIQAIQMISGSSKGLIGFLGGPWGIAFTVAATALAPFVGKLFEADEASGKAEDAAKSLGRTVDDIGSYFDRTTGRIRETNRALIEFAVLSRQRRNDELREQQRQSAKTGSDLRTESKRDLKPVFAERGLGRDAPKTINFDVQDALNSRDRDAALRAIANSNSSNASIAAQLLEERAKFAQANKDIAKNDAEIRSLQSGTLDASLRDAPKKEREKRERAGKKVDTPDPIGADDFASELRNAAARVARAKLSQAATAEEQLDVDLTEIENARQDRDLGYAKRVKAKELSEAQAKLLTVASGQLAEAETALAKERVSTEATQRAAEIEQMELAGKATMLRLQGDLATTAEAAQDRAGSGEDRVAGGAEESARSKGPRCNPRPDRPTADDL